MAVAMGFAPSLNAVSAFKQGKINRDEEGNENQKLD